MAARRMFMGAILEEDQFLSMSARAQILYVHLAMHADDDGFVDRVRSVRKNAGAGERDLRALIERGYLIAFPSGVVVITHWHLHNRIRKDTYSPTKYRSEWGSLVLDGSRTYRLRDGAVTEPLRECATDKIRIDKLSIDKISIAEVSSDQVSPAQDCTTGKDRETDSGPVQPSVYAMSQALGLPPALGMDLHDWIAARNSRHGSLSPAGVRRVLVRVKEAVDRYGREPVRMVIEQATRLGSRDLPLEGGP